MENSTATSTFTMKEYQKNVEKLLQNEKTLLESANFAIKQMDKEFQHEFKKASNDDKRAILMHMIFGAALEMTFDKKIW